MPAATDHTGKRFGRLVCRSLEYVNGRRMWRCECDCGNTRAVKPQSLVDGLTKSCGCIRKGGRPTHGMSRSTEYSIWQNMRERCTNPKRREYKNYGGRGIPVCTRWLVFEWFYKDMGPRPPGKTLDRKNNDKGYNKANCRWATRSEQERNKRPRLPKC